MKTLFRTFYGSELVVFYITDEGQPKYYLSAPFLPSIFPSFFYLF